MDPLLAQDVAYACWEVTTSTCVETSDAWTMWLLFAATVRDGCHSSSSNTSYALGTYSIFSVLFSVFSVFVVRGHYTWISINRHPEKGSIQSLFIQYVWYSNTYIYPAFSGCRSNACPAQTQD